MNGTNKFMITENTIQLSDYANLLVTKDAVSLEEYLSAYKSRITQESEELFVRDFSISIIWQKLNIKI